MLLEYLQKSINLAYFFPPIVFFKDGKNSSNDISKIAASSLITWKATILNYNKCCSSVV